MAQDLWDLWRRNYGTARRNCGILQLARHGPLPRHTAASYQAGTPAHDGPHHSADVATAPRPLQTRRRARSPALARAGSVDLVVGRVELPPRSAPPGAPPGPQSRRTTPRPLAPASGYHSACKASH